MPISPWRTILLLRFLHDDAGRRPLFWSLENISDGNGGY
jgi:hypothetical protein